jgi:hypothetical protein
MFDNSASTRIHVRFNDCKVDYCREGLQVLRKAIQGP